MTEGFAAAPVDALRDSIQERVVEEALLCLLADGHGLLEGAPRLAKTLPVRSLAQAMHLDFRRMGAPPRVTAGSR